MADLRRTVAEKAGITDPVTGLLSADRPTKNSSTLASSTKIGTSSTIEPSKTLASTSIVSSPRTGQATRTGSSTDSVFGSPAPSMPISVVSAPRASIPSVGLPEKDGSGLSSPLLSTSSGSGTIIDPGIPGAPEKDGSSVVTSPSSSGPVGIAMPRPGGTQSSSSININISKPPMPIWQRQMPEDWFGGGGGLKKKLPATKNKFPWWLLLILGGGYLYWKDSKKSGKKKK